MNDSLNKMQNYLLLGDTEYNIWMIWSEQDLENDDYILLYGSNGEDMTVEKAKFWDIFKKDDPEVS